MKTNKYILYFVLCPLVLLVTSCEPRAYTPDDVFVKDSNLSQILDAENPRGYKIFTLNEFVDSLMTEQGNFMSDTTPYRTRANSIYAPEIYLFSVDTIPTDTIGIYIRGRVTTDDYAGNFYKSMVIQQIVDGKQQNLRISVDLGSSGGMYQIGQELLIRCNGLAVGKYANQPQLCVPSYNNNIFSNLPTQSQKVGWAPGRIPGAKFRNAARMIGAPDQSKLVYDTVTISEIVVNPAAYTEEGMKAVRRNDGRLVVLKNVFYTGQYDTASHSKDFLPRKCDTNHPDSSSNANVFAPTTNNIGFPQSRLVADESWNYINVSSSEYAKFANYYLPGADKDGVDSCRNWVGTITGILGFYMDVADDFQNKGLGYLKYKWSVTPRGIPGIGIEDIKLHYKSNPDSLWIPQEYNPQTNSSTSQE